MTRYSILRCPRLWRRAAAILTIAGLAAPMATPASADTINVISDGAGLQVLDDESLADIRGKGAEGADVTAPDQVAVILWDELGTGRPSGQKGGGQVASANATSVQSFSHTATRH